MTISQFPRNNNAEMRSMIIKMEDIILKLENDVKSLGADHALLYQMGRVSMASANVANALRDFVKELESLENKTF